MKPIRQAAWVLFLGTIVSAVGCGGGSDDDDDGGDSAAEKLKAPTEVQVTARGSSLLDVSWKDNSLDEDSFDVSYKNTNQETAASAVAGANENRVTLSRLAPSTEYEVYVRARKGTGRSAPSATVTATTGKLEWSILSTSGTKPPARVDHTLVMDTTQQRMIVFGGFDGINVNLKTLALDLKSSTPSWSEISSTAGPQRRLHSAVYDPVKKRMLVFGGYSYPPTNYYDELWELSLSGSPTWKQLQVKGAVPSPRVAHSAILDSAAKKMYVFGGVDSNGLDRNELFTLDLEQDPPVWVSMNTGLQGPLPLPRYRHTAIHDRIKNQMIVYGGLPGPMNDVWALNLEGGVPQWKNITPSGGTVPEGRSEHSAIFDKANHRMIVFGGVNNNGTKKDTWAFDLSAVTPSWTELVPPGTVPQNRGPAVADAVNQRLLFFGGSDDTYALAH